MENKKPPQLSCPIPLQDYPHVLLAHGGGGTLMHRLIEEIFVAAFDNAHLCARHDSAVLNIPAGKIAMTTDSFVVRPLFFPGGDIGSLAVNGTVNDLAMSGARPLYLTAGFILEEGLSLETLWRIVNSMKEAAHRADVKIVTGDTKVVEKGKGDGIFINTAGIGIIEHNQTILPGMIRKGDAVLVSGDLGRHGMAVMALRQGLEFETTLTSDSAPLAGLIGRLLSEGIEIHCLRDLTRGGLASALNEIAMTAQFGIEIEESRIPVCEEVKGACEILGFDPLYVANEGRFVAFVAAGDAGRALDIIKKDPLGAQAALIGTVTDSHSSLVTMKTAIGVSRIVDMLSGEQLPRIC